jgi:hypothetical protein
MTDSQESPEFRILISTIRTNLPGLAFACNLFFWVVLFFGTCSVAADVFCWLPRLLYRCWIALIFVMIIRYAQGLSEKSGSPGKIFISGPLFFPKMLASGGDMCVCVCGGGGGGKKCFRTLKKGSKNFSGQTPVKLRLLHQLCCKTYCD